MNWYLYFLEQLARDHSLCGEAAYSSRIWAMSLLWSKHVEHGLLSI